VISAGLDHKIKAKFSGDGGFCALEQLAMILMADKMAALEPIRKLLREPCKCCVQQRSHGRSKIAQ